LIRIQPQHLMPKTFDGVGQFNQQSLVHYHMKG
jgi:hypothetical protein